MALHQADPVAGSSGAQEGPLDDAAQSAAEAQHSLTAFLSSSPAAQASVFRQLLADRRCFAELGDVCRRDKARLAALEQTNRNLNTMLEAGVHVNEGLRELRTQRLVETVKELCAQKQLLCAQLQAQLDAKEGELAAQARRHQADKDVLKMRADHWHHYAHKYALRHGEKIKPFPENAGTSSSGSIGSSPLSGFSSPRPSGSSAPPPPPVPSAPGPPSAHPKDPRDPRGREPSQGQTDELRKELLRTKDDLRQARTELELEKGKHLDSKTRLDKLLDQQKGQRESIESFSKQVKSLNQENKDLKDREQKMRVDNANLHTLHNKDKASIGQQKVLRQKLDEARTELAKVKEDLGTLRGWSRDALPQELGAARKSLRDKAGALEDAAKAQDGLRSALGLEEGRVADAKAVRKALKRAREEGQAEAKAEAESATRLAKADGALAEKVRRLEAEVLRERGFKESVQARLTQAGDEVRGLADAREEAEEELSRWQAALAGEAERRRQLEAFLALHGDVQLGHADDAGLADLLGDEAQL